MFSPPIDSKPHDYTSQSSTKAAEVALVISSSFVRRYIPVLICIYPTALRASPATVPGLIGSLVESLIGWVKRFSIEEIFPKSTKLGSKIHQVGIQNRLKSKPKSSLEGSWGHLGPKRPQEAPREKKRVRKGRAFAPPAPPSGGPKSTKIGAKSDQKYDLFFD